MEETVLSNEMNVHTLSGHEPESYEKYKREMIALDCLKAMLLNPSVMNQGFDVIADFAFRQADAFLAKSKEPQI